MRQSGLWAATTNGCGRACPVVEGKQVRRRGFTKHDERTFLKTRNIEPAHDPRLATRYGYELDVPGIVPNCPETP